MTIEKTFDNCCNLECSAKKNCERFRCTAGHGCYEWAHGNGKFYFNECRVCINPNKYGNYSGRVETAQLDSGKWVFGCGASWSTGGFGDPCMYGENCQEYETERDAVMAGIKAIRERITKNRADRDCEETEESLERIFDTFNQLSLF